MLHFIRYYLEVKLDFSLDLDFTKNKDKTALCINYNKVPLKVLQMRFNHIFIMLVKDIKHQHTTLNDSGNVAS